MTPLIAASTSSYTLKQIASQMDEIFNGDPWYGRSMLNILASVNPGFVFILPAPGTHSIAELVAHMITWRMFAVRRLKGDSEYLPDQEESFNWKRITPSRNKAWVVLKDQLISNQDQLLTLLSNNDDSLLEKQVAGKPYTFQYLLQGILEHDLYHLGQIAYIHKMHQVKYGEGASVLEYSFRIFSYENLSQLK